MKQGAKVPIVRSITSIFLGAITTPEPFEKYGLLLHGDMVWDKNAFIETILIKRHL